MSSFCLLQSSVTASAGVRLQVASGIGRFCPRQGLTGAECRLGSLAWVDTRRTCSVYFPRICHRILRSTVYDSLSKVIRDFFTNVVRKIMRQLIHSWYMLWHYRTIKSHSSQRRPSSWREVWGSASFACEISAPRAQRIKSARPCIKTHCFFSTNTNA